MSDASACFCYSELDDSTPVVNGSYGHFVPFDQHRFRSNPDSLALPPANVLIMPVSPTPPDLKTNQSVLVEYPVSIDSERLLVLLSGISNENIHAEVEWGTPQGNEEW
jgi:hypothetical protein